MESTDESHVEVIELQPTAKSGVSRMKRQVSHLGQRICQNLPRINIKQKTENRLWTFSMFLLGTLDVLINWLNFYEMNSAGVSNGLVIGPPTHPQWMALLVFCIIGTVLYIPESLNTFSSLWNNGRTYYPIVWELMLILPLEQIPLSAINYFIVRCRLKYINSTQTFCGITNIVFVFVRLLWFAHMEGNLKEKKTPNRKLYFMLCGALFSSAFAFPVMSWRMRMEDVDWKDVKILLIRTPELKDSHIGEYNITQHLQNQGLPLDKPWLVKSLQTVGYNTTHVYTERYHCNMDYKLVPPLCEQDSDLVFRFAYIDKNKAPPFGRIIYNMAVVNGSVCTEASSQLSDGWGLFYVTIKRVSDGMTSSVYALDPWPDQCTTSPYPAFDKSVSVCTQIIKGINDSIQSKSMKRFY